MCTDRGNSETSKLEELSPLVCATDVTAKRKTRALQERGWFPLQNTAEN